MSDYKSNFTGKQIDERLLKTDLIGDLSQLNTASKTTLVEALNSMKSEIMQSVTNASSTTYNLSKAYTDNLVNKFSQPLNLYLTNAGITLTQPTGAGTLVPIDLTITEKLWFKSDYIIPESGFIDKNLYLIQLPFTSISSSRITYIRCKWILKNSIVIFDKWFILQNTTSDFDFSEQVVGEFIGDSIPYLAGDKVTFELYGRVSSGTDNASLLLGDSEKTALIARRVPTV